MVLCRYGRKSALSTYSEPLGYMFEYFLATLRWNALLIVYALRDRLRLGLY